MYSCMYVCSPVCIFLCSCICMYDVCEHVCVHACMHLCLYGSHMYMCIYSHTCQQAYNLQPYWYGLSLYLYLSIYPSLSVSIYLCTFTQKLTQHLLHCDSPEHLISCTHGHWHSYHDSLSLFSVLGCTTQGTKRRNMIIKCVQFFHSSQCYAFLT
jgi:hypothetical protein